MYNIDNRITTEKCFIFLKVLKLLYKIKYNKILFLKYPYMRTHIQHSVYVMYIILIFYSILYIYFLYIYEIMY